MTDNTEIRSAAGDVIATTDSGLPTIQAALNAVMRDVQEVKKADRNQHANYNFRGIDAVVNATGPALRQHGVIVVPEVISVKYEDVKTSGGKLQNACRVLVRYFFIGPAGDQISCTVAGEAWDGGDKATPQAMSVAFRIALLQALALPTDAPDVDAREPYQRIPEEPATAEQFTAIGNAFVEAGVTDPTQKAGIVAASTGRQTNGSDMTKDEATALLAEINSKIEMKKAEANLTESLGAQPIDNGDPDTQPPSETQATALVDTP